MDLKFRCFSQINIFVAEYIMNFNIYEWLNHKNTQITLIFSMIQIQI